MLVLKCKREIKKLVQTKKETKQKAKYKSKREESKQVCAMILDKVHEKNRTRPMKETKTNLG